MIVIQFKSIQKKKTKLPKLNSNIPCWYILRRHYSYCCVVCDPFTPSSRTTIYAPEVREMQWASCSAVSGGLHPRYYVLWVYAPISWRWALCERAQIYLLHYVPFPRSDPRTFSTLLSWFVDSMYFNATTFAVYLWFMPCTYVVF